MIFFWPKVYGPLGKTPYIYPRYQVWGVTDLNFDLAYYHPPLVKTNICYPRKKYTKYTNRNHISCAQFHCEQNVKQLPIATEQLKIFMKSLIQERCHKTMIF